MTTIYFASNRNYDANRKSPFGNLFHIERPFFFRVGAAEVRRTADPWERPDAAYQVQDIQIASEQPPESPEDDARLIGSFRLFRDMRKHASEQQSDALIYIHGFASTFEMCLERAAELADAYLSPGLAPNHEMALHDAEALGSDPVSPMMFAFSWPSDGITLGRAERSDDEGVTRWAYYNDRDDAEASGKAMARSMRRLIDFLDKRQRKAAPCRQRLHLVAHSMGVWALRSAVQALKIKLDGRLPRLFDEVFLMAADEDDDALEVSWKLAPLVELSSRIHVYFSRTDTALKLSDIAKGNPDRLGENGPKNFTRLPSNVIGVDCTAVDDTPSLTHGSHQYYRLSPEVLRDVRAVLDGEPIDRIEGRVAIEPGRKYRILRDEAARD